MTDAPLLEVDNLSVEFQQRGAPTVNAVRGISYHVNRGEFLGIVGESGSGKSVSSMAVMGLLPSTARVTGDIRYRGESLLERDDKALSRLRGKEIAMVFQDPLSALTPVYTVGNQITEALKLHDSGLSDKAADARVIELLNTVGIPAPERRAKAFPHEFSGGMRQRVMIAMAIANDPDLIIADEPTTALDVTIQAQILEVLQKAKEVTGAAVVLITHDLGVVAGNVDRVAVMYAGRLVETGTVEQVLTAPRMPYTMGLLRSVPNMQTAGRSRLVPMEGRPPSLAALPPGCPFEPRCPASIDACSTAEPPLVQIGGTGPAARQVACVRADEFERGTLGIADVFPRPEPVPPEEQAQVKGTKILQVTDLKRHFPLTKGVVFRKTIGSVKAVDGITFDIEEKQVLGLVGESGCGKSTTILEILELARPQSGSIELNGVDVASLSSSNRLKLRGDVQVVFQDPMAAIDPRLSIEDIVSEPLTVLGASRSERSAKVRELLETVGLDPAMSGRYPHQFSGGQRQRIGIARALATDPKLLILDEPVSALDVSIQAGVINLLQDLKDSRGLSYLFVAHDLAVVRQIADVVAVMYLGRIVELGEADNVFSHPQHPYTQALLSAVPIPDPRVERTRQRVLLEGDLPSPTQEITGCNFHGRCPLFKILDASHQERCVQTDPSLRSVHNSSVACHFAEENPLRVTGVDITEKEKS
ncbi:dipeptide ABC transporter ATP-binding protein [Allobranchiibius huperziae]|uniref:Peptide/nickel transport system ATP-binding protein n=1 Tax=Allobranchiibius huperziae TaxID=1874116 RepID=A0A853DAC4_9MICO|nr:peptide/nickel transport system ATP-binding protein [Allobranchiibius huperziae]